MTAPSSSGRTPDFESGSRGSNPRGASSEQIPTGHYCYARIGPMDEHGIMRIKGMCPYWERRPGEHAYCGFLDYETESARELLWDQVKVCGVRDWPDED